jgi:hypothetical protein
MLKLRYGCNYFPASKVDQMQKQVTQLAQEAGRATSNFRPDEAKPAPNIRRESEANVLAFIVQRPPKLNALRRSNGKTAEFLLQLEAENAELRHQAVELALQIQKLVESRLP